MTFKLALVAALVWLTAPALHAQIYGAPAPDIAAAKSRGAVCFSCHGENGISVLPGTPSLAGQNRLYLEKALHAYRLGQTRTDPTMTAMAHPLSDRDIVNLAAYFSLQVPMANGKTAADELEKFEQSHPASVAAVAGSASPAAAAAVPAATAAVAARSGEAVYHGTCVACHGSGAAGAPKLGDKAAWAPRIAEGTDVLVEHALHGFKAMPAKGACGDCSDAEIKAAVDYMVTSDK